jgi:hypothetical protein
MKKADMMIMARLEVHNDLMNELIQSGLQKSEASSKAFDAVTKDDNAKKKVKQVYQRMVLRHHIGR